MNLTGVGGEEEDRRVDKGGRGAGEQMQRSAGKEREEGLTLFFALGSAPLASSSEAASVLPLIQAQCSGV